MSTNNTRDWEERFNSLWKSTSAWNLHPHDSQPVIEFIHQELQKARDEERERILSWCKSNRETLNHGNETWEVVDYEEVMKAGYTTTSFRSVGSPEHVKPGSFTNKTTPS